MFDFLQTIFIKITSAVASIIIAVGLVSAPAPQPEPPPQVATMVEIKQEAQELEKIKLEAELKKAKAETAKAQAETKKAQMEAEETKRLSDIKSGSESVKSTPSLIETWEQQEARDFVYADNKGWTSLISTNSLGEKRYYRKEGNQWIRKNSGAEAQATYSPATSRLKICMEQMIKDMEAGYSGGRLSDCTGTTPTQSYSSPPAYSPPSSYTPHDYSSSLPSADDMIKKSDEWWENYRQEQLNKTVCEGIGKNYYGPLGCR